MSLQFTDDRVGSFGVELAAGKYTREHQLMLASHLQTAATAQFLIMSIVLLVLWLKNQRNQLVAFLAIFFTAKALAMLDYTLSKSFHVWVLNAWPVLDLVLLPCLYLYIPAYYFYIKTNCDSCFRFNWPDTVHFVPALLFALVIVFKASTLGYERLVSLLEVKQFFGFWEKLVFFKARNILVLAYLGASLMLISRYRRNIKKPFSVERSKQLTWLILLTVGLAIISLWAVVRTVLSFFFELNTAVIEAGRLVSTVLLFLFAFCVVLMSVGQSSIISLGKFRSGNRFPRNALSEQRDWERLLKFVETESPYLKAGLTLDEFSAALHLPSRYVTELLQQRSKNNFLGFVNAYRVAEARRRLIEQPSLSVIEILHESGFSSKSTFNAVFKQASGLTPSQYRAQILSNVKDPAF